MDDLIDWEYPDLSNGNINSASSIITSINKDVSILNKKCILKISLATNAIDLASSDEVVIEDDHIEAQNFQEEYLNTIPLSGLPPHLLELKMNTHVVLIRNLDPSNDLCNGTQLQVQAISNQILTCRILNGPNQNDIIHIPRIDLHYSDNDLPFTLRRCQYPVKSAFAMTINKSQGQSFESVGIYLSKPVFGHGQLYVAMSRAGIAANTKLFIVNATIVQGKFAGYEGTHTKNIVYHEVLTTT